MRDVGGEGGRHGVWAVRRIRAFLGWPDAGLRSRGGGLAFVWGEGVEGGRGGIPPRDGGLGVVELLAMRTGGRFEEHSTPGPISSVVRGGRIPFAAGGEAWSGAVLACYAWARHAAEALSDAACHIDWRGAGVRGARPRDGRAPDGSRSGGHLRCGGGDGLELASGLRPERQRGALRRRAGRRGARRRRDGRRLRGRGEMRVRRGRRESTPWAWGSWSSCPGALGVRRGAPPRASPTSPSTGGAGRLGSELE